MLETISTEKESPAEPIANEAADYGIFVRSIGSANASIVAVLKSASKLSEQVLAYRLFQAPSMLFRDLPKGLADEAVAALRSSGLDCETRHKDERFTPGDTEHEVALVIRDITQMSALLESVMKFLGVSAVDARRLLCASPAVLLGRISIATVRAVQERFTPLGVEVDVSRSPSARYDVFMNSGSAEMRRAAEGAAKSLGIHIVAAQEGDANPPLAMNLTHEEADRFFAVMSRSLCPVILLNRDFQRFDVRLDAASDTPELRAFLVETAQMPENIVPKLLARLPIVTHSCVGFSRMTEVVQTFAALGGKASAHPLAFQTFSLRIEKVGDVQSSTTILRGIGGLAKEAAHEALTKTKEVPGPLAPTVAKWLRYELEKAGTKSRMVLR